MDALLVWQTSGPVAALDLSAPTAAVSDMFLCFQWLRLCCRRVCTSSGKYSLIYYLLTGCIFPHSLSTAFGSECTDWDVSPCDHRTGRCAATELISVQLRCNMHKALQDCVAVCTQSSISCLVIRGYIQASVFASSVQAAKCLKSARSEHRHGPVDLRATMRMVDYSETQTTFVQYSITPRQLGLVLHGRSSLV